MIETYISVDKIFLEGISKFLVQTGRLPKSPIRFNSYSSIGYQKNRHWHPDMGKVYLLLFNELG